MSLYNATPQEVEQIIKDIGTGYPSKDHPWRFYYSREAIKDPLPECSVYQYLHECNRRNLDSHALNYFGKKFTYRDLFKRIDDTAKAFRAQGVQPGDIVPIVTVTCVPAVVCFYALNKIGAIVNYVNVQATAKDMVKFFRNNNSNVIVTADIFVNKVMLAARANGAARVITFSLQDDLPVMKRLGKAFAGGDVVEQSYLQDKIALKWDRFIASGRLLDDEVYFKDPSKAALLAQTGGTTGSPKSVLLSDNALNAVAFQYHYLFEAEPEEVFLNLVPPFIVYGSLINMHMPLTMTCCVGLVPKFDPEDWPEYFNKYQPNYLTVVPNYLAPMLTNPRMRNVNLDFLKVIAVGGEMTGNALEIDFNRFLKEHGSKAKLTKGYGMTELCSVGCTCSDRVNALGSVGIPLPRNELMIYDNDRFTECRFNEVGEVCFQSPSQMIGYLNEDEANESVIRKHRDGTYWLHTGDLGYMNRKGLVYIVGRIKRVVLTTYKGVAYRVYPNVVEDMLRGHPAVREACVVRLHDDMQGRTKAYVALHDHNRVDEEELERELRSFCESEMAAYMRPFLYEFRGSLPQTPAGKVDYKLLENQTEGLG